METDLPINEEAANSEKVLLAPVLISRDTRHSHFWIEDEELFESYHTIRGLRYHHRFSVNGLPDTDKCKPDMIKYIEAEYLS